MLRTMQSEYDRLLLQEEIRRLKARGFSFQGETEEARLGVDRWVLGVQIVEDKGKGKGTRKANGEWKGLEA